MNCTQTNSRFVAYLSGELPLKERAAIQAHLAECANCRGELAVLANLETQLTRHLNLQAEQVSSATQSWGSLQSRLAQEHSGQAFEAFRSFANRVRFEWPAARKWVLALLIILILWTAPPVRTLAARLGDWVGTWFQFNTPGTESSMGVGGFEAFTPYVPQYLPTGFDSSGLGSTTAPGLDQLALTYSDGDQFVTLLQSKGTGTERLPQEKSITINGQTGVFVRVFATSGEQLQQQIPSIPVVTNFDYSTTSLLAWHLGEVKIELISNLPETEIMKIAGSLVLVEGTSADFPVNQAP